MLDLAKILNGSVTVLVGEDATESTVSMVSDPFSLTVTVWDAETDLAVAEAVVTVSDPSTDPVTFQVMSPGQPVGEAP